MTALETFERLHARSDAHYQAACAANHNRDREAYLRETHAAWDCVNQAKPYFEQLTAEQQQHIRDEALVGMMTGYVRGLFGGAKC